jgi:hypothetical protein
MGEFTSKEHWQNFYGTVEDDFLEIDAIIENIVIFFSYFAVADHISLTVREKGSRKGVFGPLLKKKQELGGARFINKACKIDKRLLGTFAVLQVQSKFRRSKFSQMEESCPQYQQVLLV